MWSVSLVAVLSLFLPVSLFCCFELIIRCVGMTGIVVLILIPMRRSVGLYPFASGVAW